MGAQLLAVKSSGDKNGLSIVWAAGWNGGANSGTTTSTPDALVVPPFPYVTNVIGPVSASWGQYTLNPQAVQAASNFGTAKALSLNIQRTKQWYVDSTHYNTPGRVAVQVSASNDILMFSAEETLVLPTSPVSNQTILECTNTFIPIWTKDSAPINIFIEPDYVDGSSVNIRTIVLATLFNYDINASGFIG